MNWLTIIFRIGGAFMVDTVLLAFQQHPVP